jgi:hypothetical protein
VEEYRSFEVERARPARVGEPTPMTPLAGATPVAEEIAAAPGVGKGKSPKKAGIGWGGVVFWGLHVLGVLIWVIVAASEDRDGRFIAAIFATTFAIASLYSWWKRHSRFKRWAILFSVIFWIVPTFYVGMPPWTLRVPSRGAERRGRHSHEDRGNDKTTKKSTPPGSNPSPSRGCR